MNREDALIFFFNLMQDKFNANPDEHAVKLQLEKMAIHKAEAEANERKRLDAMKQFKIQFNPATFTLSQTQVKPNEFPELTPNWNRGTIEFINELAKTAQESRDKQLSSVKLLNYANERIKTLDEELNKKYVANKDALSAKITALESTLADLTRTNEEQSKNLTKMQKENQSLNGQISRSDEQIKKLSEEAIQKDSENAQLKSEKDTFEKKMSDLQKMLDDCNEIASDHKNEIDALHVKLSAQILVNSVKERELKTKETVESDNSVLKDILSKRDAELQKMHGEIDSIRAGSKDAENQYKIEKTRMQIVFDAQKSLMEKQQEYRIHQMTEEITKNSSSSNADLVKQIEELKAHSEKEKASLAEAMQKTEALEKSKQQIEEEKTKCETEKSDLDDARKKCETEKGTLEQRIEQNIMTISEIEKEIASLTFEQTRLKHAKDEQSLNHAKKLFQLEKEKERIHMENDELNERLRILKLEHDALKVELGTLKETYEKATQELKDASAEELKQLLLKQDEEIAESANREKQVNMKFEIDACLIKNSIASLGWNNWKNAQNYFVEIYGKVEITEIAGLQNQIAAISKSGTLDNLIQSFGMLKPLLASSSSISSVEPECMKNLVDLIIKFLHSQKEIEESQKETELSKQQHELLVKQNEKLIGDLTALEATQGEKEKADLQQKIIDLRKQMNDQNDELTSKLETADNANITIDQLRSELDKIKEELESSEIHKNLSIGTNELLQNQKQELEEEVKKHFTNVQEITSEMNVLKKNVTKQSTENDMLKKQIDTIEFDNKYLAHQLTDAANENVELTKKFDEMVNAASTEIGELEEVINNLKTDFNNKQGELKETQGKLESTQSVLEAKQGELESTQSALEAKQGELETKKRELANIKENMTKLESTHKILKDELEALKLANDRQKQEHDRAIQEAKDEYEKQKAQINTQNATVESQLQKISDIEAQLRGLTNEKAKCEIDFNAIKQQLPEKDDLIAKLQQKLSDIYKQQIIEKANNTLSRMNYKAPTYVAPSTIKLTKTNRDAAKKLLDMFGGSGITMKGGAVVYFSYDDTLLQNLDPNDINILTNEEIAEIEGKIKLLKDKISALESNSASPDKLKLLIQELLLIKTAHAQNFKDLLFEKIANGVNKQIIATQAPAIEQLKTANKDLETANKDLTTKHADLEAANKDLTTKHADLEAKYTGLETTNAALKTDLTNAKNAATVSSGTTAAVTAAKTSLNSGSSSGMFRDNNVIYYKTAPIS